MSGQNPSRSKAVVALTIEQKHSIIEALKQPGTKQVEVADRFGVTPACIYKLWKNRDTIVQQVENTSTGGKKRQRLREGKFSLSLSFAGAHPRATKTSEPEIRFALRNA